MRDHHALQPRGDKSWLENLGGAGTAGIPVAPLVQIGAGVGFPELAFIGEQRFQLRAGFCRRLRTTNHNSNQRRYAATSSMVTNQQCNNFEPGGQNSKLNEIGLRGTTARTNRIKLVMALSLTLHHARAGGQGKPVHAPMPRNWLRMIGVIEA